MHFKARTNNRKWKAKLGLPLTIIGWCQFITCTKKLKVPDQLLTIIKLSLICNYPHYPSVLSRKLGSEPTTLIEIAVCWYISLPCFAKQQRETKKTIAKRNVNVNQKMTAEKIKLPLELQLAVTISNLPIYLLLIHLYICDPALYLKLLVLLCRFFHPISFQPNMEVS